MVKATKIPDFQDEVKHKYNDAVGIVITKYADCGGIFFDVRVGDSVVYDTPAENWETIRTEEERL